MKKIKKPLLLKILSSFITFVSLSLIISGLFMSTGSFAADSLSTVDVIQNTFSGIPDCLHYHITGICFWLECEGI